MESFVTKSELLRRLDQGKADFDAVLARLTPDQGDRLMVTEAWTVKDLIAHLTAHEQRALEELRAAVRGQRPDVLLGDNDAFNLGAVMACRTMGYGPIKDAWDRSFAEVVQMVQSLADADFEPSSRLEGLLDDTVDGALANNTYEHYAAHQVQVEAALSNLFNGG